MNKLSFLTTGAASLQWIFFIFANTVVVPVSIGTAFELAPAEIAMMLRVSLIFTGIACVLQGLWGHRYPLMEGHSGLMWGLLLNLSLSGAAMGMEYETIGGGIATGVLAAGIFTSLIGAFRLSSLLQKIFTPMVVSVYLFLLSVQLISIFFTGMLKLTPEGSLDLPVSLFSIILVVIVSALKIKGTGFISNFSILIGIVGGWILFALFFPEESSAAVSGGGSVLQLFPLGQPNLEWGIVLAAFLAGVLNMSNTVSSVYAAAALYHEEPQSKRLNRSFILTGFYSVVAAFFGLVPYAPFTSSIGFLESTRIFERKPFLIGGALFSLLGIIPAAGLFFSALPITVGNAVLFVAYLQLFGTALKSVQGDQFNSDTIFRLAAPILTGICIMAMSADIFSSLPMYVRPIISNGLIMGVLISVVMEKTVNWEKLSGMASGKQ